MRVSELVHLFIFLVFSWNKISVTKFLMSLFLQDALEGSRPITPFRSFDNQNRRDTVQVHARSKSVLSAFFVKQKALKLKAGSFSWVPPKANPLPPCKLLYAGGGVTFVFSIKEEWGRYFNLPRCLILFPLTMIRLNA